MKTNSFWNLKYHKYSNTFFHKNKRPNCRHFTLRTGVFSTEVPSPLIQIKLFGSQKVFLWFGWTDPFMWRMTCIHKLSLVSWSEGKIRPGNLSIIDVIGLRRSRPAAGLSALFFLLTTRSLLWLTNLIWWNTEHFGFFPQSHTHTAPPVNTEFDVFDGHSVAEHFNQVPLRHGSLWKTSSSVLLLRLWVDV